MNNSVPPSHHHHDDYVMYHHHQPPPPHQQQIRHPSHYQDPMSTAATATTTTAADLAPTASNVRMPPSSMGMTSVAPNSRLQTAAPPSSSTTAAAPTTAATASSSSTTAGMSNSQLKRTRFASKDGSMTRDHHPGMQQQNIPVSPIQHEHQPRRRTRSPNPGAARRSRSPGGGGSSRGGSYDPSTDIIGPAPPYPNTTGSSQAAAGGGEPGLPPPRLRGRDYAIDAKQHQCSLSLDEAEYFLMQAALGNPLPPDVEIVRGSLPYLPKGGTMILVQRDTPLEDGYGWKEVMNNPNIKTDKGNSMHHRLAYIARPKVSSKFRRESYTMGDWMLIGYYGDANIAQPVSPNPAILARGKNSSISASSTAINNQTAFNFNETPTASMTLPRASNRGRAANKELLPTATSRSSSTHRNLPDHQTDLEFDIHTHHHQHHQQQLPVFSTASPATAIRPKPSTALPLSTSPAYLAVGNETLTSSSSSSLVFPPLASSSWFHELVHVAEELASGKVVKNLTIFPSLQLTLVHPDMTKEFENCCNLLCGADMNEVSDENQNGIKLFYDTTFSFGHIYGTILTFVNSCYDGDPVMPLAVNLHERKFKSSHQLFWARIVGDLPALQKYRFPLIIDDAEPAVHLAVRTQAPNLIQIEAWTHRFRDIDRYLRSKGYGDEAADYFKACISYLLHSESKQAMHDKFRKEFEIVWPKDFIFYYRQRLLPRSGRLGRWAMNKMKISHDDLFLSPHTNPQVEFHITCQQFAGWDRLSSDQLVRAFYFLFLYFVSESSDSKVADGVYQLKHQYTASAVMSGGHRSRLKASYKYIPHPSQICEFVLRNYPRADRIPPPAPLVAAAAAAAAGNNKPTTSSMKMAAYASGETAVYAASTGDPLAALYKTAAGGKAAAAAAAAAAKMESDVCDIEYTLENLLGGGGRAAAHQHNKPPQLDGLDGISSALYDLKLGSLLDEEKYPLSATNSTLNPRGQPHHHHQQHHPLLHHQHPLGGPDVVHHHHHPQDHLEASLHNGIFPEAAAKLLQRVGVTTTGAAAASLNSPSSHAANGSSNGQPQTAAGGLLSSARLAASQLLAGKINPGDLGYDLQDRNQQMLIEQELQQQLERHLKVATATKNASNPHILGNGKQQLNLIPPSQSGGAVHPDTLDPKTTFALTTIPENPSIESRPVSGMDWSFDSGAPGVTSRQPSAHSFNGGPGGGGPGVAPEMHRQDASAVMPITTVSNNHQQHRPQATARGLIATTSSTAAAALTTATTSTSSPPPSSLMLWKKVQHYVVFGGSFISSQKERQQQRKNSGIGAEGGGSNGGSVTTHGQGESNRMQ